MPMCTLEDTYFNPRTREGCDFKPFLISLCTLAISIHAPVKGATLEQIHFYVFFSTISIHAPVKGATLRPSLGQSQYRQISIHAPVKGATELA